jgi:hypothetical protein
MMKAFNPAFVMPGVAEVRVFALSRLSCAAADDSCSRRGR